MEEQKSFKERVKEVVIQCSKKYKKYYVDHKYLICSSAFTICSYYIIAAHKDNYLHLTSLHTSLDASNFLKKCYKWTLEETDFNFCKNGQAEKEVKGSVRRKINILPLIIDLFACNTFVEEDFNKNKIRCSLAAGTTNVTLGFVVAGKAKPMTLLKGNELNPNKAKPINIVLRREAGTNKFTNIVAGSIEELRAYSEILSDKLSDELLSKISNIQ